MERKIKVGLFGGGRGSSLIKTLWKHPSAELVAVCDKYQPTLDKVEKRAAEHGIHLSLYNNFDDFIKHDMDAVILANYAHEHAIFAVRCLEAGKHVLSEVLPAATIAQGIQLIEAVEKSGLVYAYAENYCYMGHTFEMWRRIKAGELGSISYAEGEYVHDCLRGHPGLTYGDPNHWRNNSCPTFYCTHSLGPMLTAIGSRPVSVVGYELTDDGRGGRVPFGQGKSGLEMVTLENGAVCRSLHGWLRREGAPNYNYKFYGAKGMTENSRFGEGREVNLYLEGESFCRGEWEKYIPGLVVKPDIDEETIVSSGHMGSDYYPLYFFLERIRGSRAAEEWSIDVYSAVEMGMCGLLAYRSILSGNAPQRVPNFRNPAERDAYRGDNDTTFPDVEGGNLLPLSSHFDKRPVDEAYFAYLKKLYAEGKQLDHYPPRDGE